MSDNVTWHPSKVTRAERWETLGLSGATVWLTGLSGSGKSSIAVGLEARLVARKLACYRLDGDNLRHGLNADLGFSDADRDENVRRAGAVAQLFAEYGCVVLASFISPFAAARAKLAEAHAAAGLPFLEVFVDTPLDVCEARDPKGLYARARAGEIRGMTGVDAPYEAPVSPWLRLDGARPLIELVQSLEGALTARGILASPG